MVIEPEGRPPQSADGGWQTPTQAGDFELTIQLTDPSLLLSDGDSALRTGLRLALAPSVPTITTTLALSVAPGALVPTVGTVATAPLNVHATQTGPGEVTIAWEPPASSGSAPITGYSVGYGDGGSGSGGLFPANARQAVFTGLSVGDFQASVAAVTAIGDGSRASDPFTILSDLVDALPVTGVESSEALLLAGWLLLGGLALMAGTRIRRRI